MTVSENKVLTHPSTVDSITTCCGTEDHVSMGGFAARKALTVVEHVENGLPTYRLSTSSPSTITPHLWTFLPASAHSAVLGIELLSACQALDFHHEKNLWGKSDGTTSEPPQKPINTTTEPLEKVFKTLRSVVRWSCVPLVKPSTPNLAIKTKCSKLYLFMFSFSKLEKDRYMSPDMNAATKLLQEGKVCTSSNSECTNAIGLECIIFLYCLPTCHLYPCM